MPRKKGQKAVTTRLDMLPGPYPGKKGNGMEQQEWEACKAILEGVLIARNEAEDRYIADWFHSLPSDTQFPDYYETIPQPESLERVAAWMDAQANRTPVAFFNQLHLVFLNAMHYNLEGSEIWNDAKQLEAQIKHAWKNNAASGVFGPAWADGTIPTTTVNYPDSPATIAPVKRPRGRPPKNRSAAAAPAYGANRVESPHTLKFNYRPPMPTTPNGQYSPAHAQALPTPPPPPIAQPAYSLSPLPGQPPLAGTPSTSAAALATPVNPARPIPSGQPGVTQFSTPASLIPPTSPEPSVKAERERSAAMDKVSIETLEARLPKWPGPQQVLPGELAPGGIPGSGWFGEGAPDVEKQLGGPSSYSNRIRAVLHAVTEYRDTTGRRLSDAVAAVPASWDHPYISSHVPISLDSIRQTQYTSLVSFDRDMTKLFERCRRYHPAGSPEFGYALVLQRLYNALTAPYPMLLPPNGVPAPSPTLFASLPAGPGTARPVHEITQDLKAGLSENEVGYGITTYRVGTKDRIFTDEARHKGMAYKVGDYIHLINPDDASRPIIGQIFKTFVPTKGYRTHHVTVCWYYRPEQIVHLASRMFFEDEVFKTSHFCDHPVEDIIERASCQFYVKYIRGRPQAPEFYPGWPIYICHSRFNDRGWFTVRIKNWASCIPDELRQTGFMDVIPFDRQIDPQFVKSPFLRGIKGPGFFAEARETGGDDDDEEEGMPKRKAPPVVPEQQPPQRRGPGRPPGPASTPTQQQQAYQRYPQTATSHSYQTPQYRQTPPTYGQSPTQPPAQRPPPQPPIVSSSNARTVAGLMGGPQAVDQYAVREYLSLDVARLFERDSRNQVLWFSGPPLAAGQIRVPERPAHSLEYLQYLVKKKQGKEVESVANGPRGKRFKLDREPLPEASVTESGKLDGSDAVADEEAWWAQGMSEDQVLDALRGVVESA